MNDPNLGFGPPYAWLVAMLTVWLLFVGFFLFA